MYINLPLFICLSQLCFSWETSLLLYFVILQKNLNPRAPTNWGSQADGGPSVTLRHSRKKKGFCCSRPLLAPSPSSQSWDQGVTPQLAILPFLCASPSRPWAPGSGSQHPAHEFLFCFPGSLETFVLPLGKKKWVSVLHETTRKCPWDSLVFAF